MGAQQNMMRLFGSTGMKIYCQEKGYKKATNPCTHIDKVESLEEHKMILLSNIIEANNIMILFTLIYLKIS